MIQNKLQDIYNNLKSNASEEIKVINKCINDLEKTLLSDDFSPDQEKELLAFMFSEKMLPLFQRSYEVFETKLEIEFANKIISINANSQQEFKTYLLYKRFVGLIQNEIKLADITSQDKILFIGSGPIPITAILLHKLSGCEVDCCEKIEESAVLSKKVIEKLGYGNYINVINKEGAKVNYSDYTVVLIALLAKPKDLLLKETWDSVKKGVRIICRTSNLVRQAFYETTNESLFNIYQPQGKVLAKADQTISSVLLIKS